MWPRVSEALLSVWLFFSPGIFNGAPGLAVTARVAAVVMLIASLSSLVDRLRRAYLVTLGVSLVLSLLPFMQPPPASAMLQNVMIVGLVIAMFAIIPPEATKPPRGWRTMPHD